MLVDMIFLICRSQNLRLINIVDANGLKDLSWKFNVCANSILRRTNLGFDKMPNTDFGHHRYSHSFYYFLDHMRITLGSGKN
jgi:hypothetical protein